MRHARPHANSPWVIDTRALGRRAGHHARSCGWRRRSTSRSGIEVIAVPAGRRRRPRPAAGVGRRGRAGLRDRARRPRVGQCSRCLIDLTEPVHRPDPRAVRLPRFDHRRDHRRRRAAPAGRRPGRPASRWSATRSCWRCRWRRCAGRTAPACAPSAASGSMISSPVIRMRYWTLAGPLCGTDSTPRRRPIHPRARTGHRCRAPAQ